MVLKQNGETEITGTYTGRFGEMPVKGKKEGSKFTISFEVQGMEITYQGTLDGDNMSGTMKMGDMGDGKFTGNRSGQTRHTVILTFRKSGVVPRFPGYQLQIF